MKFQRKGITLVELLVTLAIVSMAIMLVGSFYFTGSKSFERSRDSSLAQGDARFVTDYIKRELKTAKNVYLKEENIEELSEGYYTLKIDKRRNLEITHSEDANKNKRFNIPVESIEFKLTKDGENINRDRLKLMVVANEDGYERKYKSDIYFENGNAIYGSHDELARIETIYYTRYDD